MDIVELKLKARNFAKEYWGLQFNLPIEVNPRMSKTLGCYKYKIKNGKIVPLSITLSKRLLTKYKEEAVISILKHELTHWALSISNKPFDDGHPVFESELKRIGAHSSHELPYVGELYQGICEKCNNVVVELKSYKAVSKYLNTPRYYHCKGYKIVYGGVVQSGSEWAKETTVNNNQQTYNKESDEIVVASKSADISDKPSDIIEIGPRGITNKQMIPAIRKSVDINSIKHIEYLRSEYPKVFEGSIRYIGKKYQKRLNELMGG